MKKIVTGILVGLNIVTAGLALGANKNTQKLEHTIDKIAKAGVVAHQVADDGEVQMTLGNGEDVTIKPNKEIIVDKTQKADTQKQKIEEPAQQPELQVVDTQEVEYKENTEKTTIKELSDGSSIVYNQDLNMYTFYPANMGDEFYEFNDPEQLKNAVATYQELAPQVEKTEKITLVNSWTQEDGDEVYELSNGSAVVCGVENNEFLLFPAEMGDWDMEFENIEDLEKAVNNYIENSTL